MRGVHTWSHLEKPRCHAACGSPDFDVMVPKYPVDRAMALELCSLLALPCESFTGERRCIITVIIGRANVTRVRV